MARIRSIKPSFFRSEDVTALSYRARLTWIGLWLFADDEGRLRDDARFVKGDLWALEDDVTWQEVEADLQELADHDRIVRYEVGGKRFIQVQKWSDHQAVPKATPSKLPPPSSGALWTPPALLLEDAAPLPDDSGSAPELLRSGSGSGDGDGSRRGKEEVELDRSLALIDPVDVDPQPSIEELFAEWWAHVSRKVSKPAAERAFTAAIASISSDRRRAADVLIAAIEEHQRHWFTLAGRSIDKTPHPATWLNARSWTDELPADEAYRTRPATPARESSLDRRDRQREDMFAALQGIDPMKEIGA